MIQRTIGSLLAVLLACPAQAAQTFARVQRAPVPVRLIPGQTGLSLKLSAPLTNPSGVPMLTPSITPALAPASPGLTTPQNVIAPMAQLENAGQLVQAGLSQKDSSAEQSGQTWSGFWNGERKTEVSDVSAPEAPSLSATPSLEKSSGKRTLLRGAGVAGGIELLRHGLQAAEPALGFLGSMTAGLLLYKPTAKAIESLGKRYGWSPRAVQVLQQTYKVLLVSAGLMFAIGAPAAAPAVWAIAGPLMSGLGVLSLTKVADTGLAKWMGTEGKVPFAGRAVVWMVGGAVALTASATGLGLGLELLRQGLQAASPILPYIGMGLAAAAASGPAGKLLGKLGDKRGWSPRAVKFARETATVALVAAAVAAPMLAPALWAAAAPYASGFALIRMTQMADDKLSKRESTPANLAARVLLWAVGGALTLEAAGFAVDLLIEGLWATVAPYSGAVGALAGTYAANRLVRWGVDRVADKAGWEPNTKVVARMVAGIVVWTGGVALGLSAAGVSTAALMTTFGIGGIAVTMAAKDFIGNFLEASKILLLKPYLVGDKIKMDKTDYVVKGMSLRYLELEQTDKPGTTTLMTYAQIAGKTITIHRPYEVKHKRYFAGGVKPVTLRDFWKAAGGVGRVAPTIHMGKAAVLAGLGLALVFGMPTVAAMAGLPWLIGALPYLKAFGALWATRWATNWVTGLVTKIGELAGWDPQAATVMKFIAQALTWGIGGTVTLSLAGVTWDMLMTGVGASSIAIGWAASDIIGNLIQGMWILATQPFKIGTTVGFGENKGKIVDMSVNFVVLEHEGGHTLVPYSVVKGSAFTVYPDTDKEKPE